MYKQCGERRISFDNLTRFCNKIRPRSYLCFKLRHNILPSKGDSRRREKSSIPDLSISLRTCVQSSQIFLFIYICNRDDLTDSKLSSSFELKSEYLTSGEFQALTLMQSVKLILQDADLIFSVYLNVPLDLFLFLSILFSHFNAYRSLRRFEVGRFQRHRHDLQTHTHKHTRENTRTCCKARTFTPVEYRTRGRRKNRSVRFAVPFTCDVYANIVLQPHVPKIAGSVPLPNVLIPEDFVYLHIDRCARELRACICARNSRTHVLLILRKM